MKLTVFHFGLLLAELLTLGSPKSFKSKPTEIVLTTLLQFLLVVLLENFSVDVAHICNTSEVLSMTSDFFLFVQVKLLVNSLF